MKYWWTDRKWLGRPLRDGNFILLILSLCIPLLRLRYFEEPLDNDIPIRLAYARRALEGAQYYSDLFVFGPAGGLWYHEIFASLFGLSHLGVYIMGSVLALVGLWGVWFTALLLGGRGAATVAAACWLVMSGDLWIQANQPNSESYMNALFAWALYFAVKSLSKGLMVVEKVLLGLLIFLASSAKHFVLIIPLMGLTGLFLAWVIDKWSGRDVRSLKDFLSPWSLVVFTVVSLWVITGVGYYATDRFDAFLHGILGESTKYAGGGFSGVAHNFVKALYPEQLLPEILAPFFFTFAAAGISIYYFARRLTAGALPWMFGGWFLGTWLAVAFPGKFFPHYYQLWMPFLSVCAAYFWVMCSSSHSDSRWGRAVVVVGFGLLVLRLTCVYWAVSPEDSVRIKYGGRDHLGELFSQSKSVGEALRPLVRASSSDVFEMGVYGVYFYTGTLAPMPFVDSLYAGTHPVQYVAEMSRFLQRHPPRYLLISRGVMLGAANEPLTVLKRQTLERGRYLPVPSLSTSQITVFTRSD